MKRISQCVFLFRKDLSRLVSLPRIYPVGIMSDERENGPASSSECVCLRLGPFVVSFHYVSQRYNYSYAYLTTVLIGQIV